MRPLYLALAVAAFALPFAAAFADDAAPGKPNLVIHLSAEKEEFAEGEPIVLTVILENDGEGMLSFESSWPPVAIIADPEWKRGPAMDGPAPPVIYHISLVPGAYWGMKLIAQRDGLNTREAPPGEYRIKAMFRGDPGKEKIESNEIRIVVKGKPGEPTEAERIKQLIADLGNNDWETRENATQVLIKIGQSAIDPLVAATRESADPETVWRAQLILKELGYVSDEAVAQKVQAILDGIKQNDWMVKETLGLEIVRLGPRVIGTLVSYLSNPDYRIRQVVVELLGKIPDKAIVQVLIDALDDSDNYVRTSAAKELRRISGQTFTSHERDKWQAWWNKNREGFHLPEVKLPEPPKPEPEPPGPLRGGED